MRYRARLATLERHAQARGSGVITQEPLPCACCHEASFIWWRERYTVLPRKAPSRGAWQAQMIGYPEWAALWKYEHMGKEGL